MYNYSIANEEDLKMEYNVYVIAYPNNSSVEKYLEEKIMNIPNPPRNPIYCCIIEGLESNDIAKDLERCINNGFEIEEEKQDDQ